MASKNKKYKIITNQEEARNWLIDHYGSFIRKNIKNADADGTLGHALFCYTGSMSSSYNDHLYKAGGNVNNLNIENDFLIDTYENIKLISDSFYKNQVYEDIVLYHYIRMSFCVLKKILKINNDVFCLNRFMSTTLLSECPGIKTFVHKQRCNIVFIINVDKNTPCIPILWKNTQSILYEYEIILPQTLRLKLKKIRWNPFKLVRWQIYFDVVKKIS